ncbi:Gfo/Idh/MocA family protein [Microbulbifer epialgicus]|uniref:Gfo/Idh/MocA family protein n=1 Tax=Microbulbifer epialgicus TaxID=393907 RepID=A0ABV4P505_9GAMM
MVRLTWGLIGGGEGSQIGLAHRIAANVDGLFQLSAGAMDLDANKGRIFAQSLGIHPSRAYGDWKEMLDYEYKRTDKLNLVTVATINSTHFEITKAFLEAGFNILCEKPMTITVEEAEEIVSICRSKGMICAVNFCYSGFSLVRQMREMVLSGELGKIRVINAEFAHGYHANVQDQENPSIRWRYSPATAGVSSVLADAGAHALHLACFVTGQEVKSISADFASIIPGRELEDDAMVNFRMDDGTVGRLWASSVAIGRMHGLTLRVFGEKGGLFWQQEHPNQLYYTPMNGRTQIIERGSSDLSTAATRASRMGYGHSEGFPMALANIYRDLFEVIQVEKINQLPTCEIDIYPKAEDGLRSMASVYAAVESAKNNGKWIDAYPPMLKVI